MRREALRLELSAQIHAVIRRPPFLALLSLMGFVGTCVSQTADDVEGFIDFDTVGGARHRFAVKAIPGASHRFAFKTIMGAESCFALKAIKGAESCFACGSRTSTWNHITCQVLANAGNRMLC
jgi:hypothetical protein